MSQFNPGLPSRRPGTNGRRWPMAVAVAVLASIGLASPVEAHTSLIGTDPGEGALLSSPPARIQLKFNEEIEGEFVVVALARGGGQAAEVANEVAGSVVTATPPGEPPSVAETWKVTYRVGSADGHPVTGSVSFTVAPSSAPASPTSSDVASPASSPTTVSSTDLAANSSAPERGQAGTLVLLAVMVVPVLGIIVVLLWRRRAS